MIFNLLVWDIILQYQGVHVLKITFRSLVVKKSSELPFKGTDN